MEERNNIIFSLETEGAPSVIGDINKIVSSIGKLSNSLATIASSITGTIASSIGSMTTSINSAVSSAVNGARRVRNEVGNINGTAFFRDRVFHSIYGDELKWNPHSVFWKDGNALFKNSWLPAPSSIANRTQQSYTWGSGFSAYVNRNGFDRQRYVFRYMSNLSGHRTPLMLGYNPEPWHGSDMPGENFVLGNVTQDPDTSRRSYIRAERARRQEHRRNSMAVTPYDYNQPRYDIVAGGSNYNIPPFRSSNNKLSFARIASSINPYLRIAHSLSHTIGGAKHIYGLISSALSFDQTDYETAAMLSGLNPNATFGRGGSISSMTSKGIGFGMFGGGFRQGWNSASSLGMNITASLQGMRVGSGGGNLMEAALKYGLNLGGSGRGGLATTEELLRNIAKTMETLTKEEKIHFSQLIGLTEQQYRTMEGGLSEYDRITNSSKWITDGIESERLSKYIKRMNMLDTQNEALDSSYDNMFSEWSSPIRLWWKRYRQNHKFIRNTITREAIDSNIPLAPLWGRLGEGLGFFDIFTPTFGDDGTVGRMAERYRRNTGNLQSSKEKSWLFKLLDGESGWFLPTYESVKSASSAANLINNIGVVNEGIDEDGYNSSGNNQSSISFGDITINANSMNPSDLSKEVVEKLVYDIAYSFRNNFGTPFKGGVA